MTEAQYIEESRNSAEDDKPTPHKRRPKRVFRWSTEEERRKGRIETYKAYFERNRARIMRHRREARQRKRALRENIPKITPEERRKLRLERSRQRYQDIKHNHPEKYREIREYQHAYYMAHRTAIIEREKRRYREKKEVRTKDSNDTNHAQ